jgi:hypothetical protein
MHNTIAKLLIIALVLAGAFNVALAQDSDVLTATTDRVRLRYGPGLEWAILGIYEAGTPMRLDGQAYEGGWVRGILPDGRYGWVIHTAVGISRGQAAQLRTVWVDDPFMLEAPAGGAAPAAQRAAPAESAPAEAPAQISLGVSQPATTTSSGPPTRLAFRPVPGPYTMPLPNLDATDPVYEFGFRPWWDDDGRINYRQNIDGMAIYCVNSSFVPEETYRNGGILVKTPTGQPILYVPAGTIAAGYQEMLRTRQNTLLGSSERLWHGGQPVALYLLNTGEFQVNFINSSGGMTAYPWGRCRPIPRDTNDNCPPGWDRHPQFGNCVWEDFD